MDQVKWSRRSWVWIHHPNTLLLMSCCNRTLYVVFLFVLFLLCPMYYYTAAEWEGNKNNKTCSSWSLHSLAEKPAQLQKLIQTGLIACQVLTLLCFCKRCHCYQKPSIPLTWILQLPRVHSSTLPEDLDACLWMTSWSNPHLSVSNPGKLAKETEISTWMFLNSFFCFVFVCWFFFSNGFVTYFQLVSTNFQVLNLHLRLPILEMLSWILATILSVTFSKQIYIITKLRYYNKLSPTSQK